MRAPIRAPFADDRERADRRVGRDDRAVGHIRRGWTPGAGRTSSANSRDGLRKGDIRLLVRSIAHGAVSAPFADDDGRRRVVRSSAAYFGIGEERQVAGPGVLDAGDAADLDAAVPFERHPSRSAMLCSFNEGEYIGERPGFSPNTRPDAIVDLSMEVFLVPVAIGALRALLRGARRAGRAGSEPPKGFIRRMVHRSRELIAEAERERRHGRTDAGAGWASRMKARTLKWVAESIAEQRLLWHLRRQESGVFYFPTTSTRRCGCDPARLSSSGLRQASLLARHRFGGVRASGLLVLVPGPNVLAYYFAFRMVGHYLSLRRARQGLRS